MSKFLTKAPFGVQTKRFATIGYHPDLDPTGSMTAYKNTLSPAEYNPERFECIYKKYNVAGSAWKRKCDCEEFSLNLGFKNHALLERRKYDKTMGGPGCYDVNEDLYKKKSFSVLQNVNFGHEQKFVQIVDNNPGPGNYAPDVTKTTCVCKKSLNKTQSFEWDGFVDRFKVPSRSWSKPPNLYNHGYLNSIDEFLAKTVSKKGPYNLFTGPRDESTIKNNFAPPKRCSPDKYYTWPNGLDYLLNHPTKRRNGCFLKDKRFRKKPSVRMLIDDLTTCYRDPKNPGPATYDININSIKQLDETLHPFNDSKFVARKGVPWTNLPGPGRYNIDHLKCRKAKIGTCVFKSTTRRPSIKAISYGYFS